MVDNIMETENMQIKKDYPEIIRNDDARFAILVRN